VNGAEDFAGEQPVRHSDARDEPTARHAKTIDRAVAAGHREAGTNARKKRRAGFGIE